VTPKARPVFGRRRARQTDPSDISPAPAEDLPRLVLLVALLEVPDDDHQAIVDHLLGKFGHSHKLVFLLSSDTFTPFLRRQVAIETFPSFQQQSLHQRLIDWPSYLAEKWEMLLLKWQPQTVISYGLNPDRFILRAREISEKAQGKVAKDH
jgi:hypothetical protein